LKSYPQAPTAHSPANPQQFFGLIFSQGGNLEYRELI